MKEIWEQKGKKNAADTLILNHLWDIQSGDPYYVAGYAAWSWGKLSKGKMKSSNTNDKVLETED